MGLRSAHRFIQQARHESDLRDAIRSVGRDRDLADLVRLGAERGFDFTDEELREAFSQDWMMRRLRYGAEVP